MTNHKQNSFVTLTAALLILSLIFQTLLAAAAEGTVYSADLNAFLTGWQLTVGDEVYDQDSPASTAIAYKEDVMYSLSLTFEERQDLQLETDGEPLTFALPQGFRIREDYTAMLNVNLGKWGTLANNPVTYDKDLHQLILRWNTADEEHMRKFRDSASAVIRLSLSGYLGGSGQEVLCINGKTFSLLQEDAHNASVTKKGSYDPVTRTLLYQVEVISDGTTSDLTLTDTMGTALTYNGDICFDSTGSVNTAGILPEITARTGNTFSVRIPAMNDKDRLVFSYSAAVDPDQIAHSGNASFEETGNTARISGDSYTADNTATYYESLIDFSDLVKNSLGVSSAYRSGILYDDIRWQIVTNKDCMYPLAGTAITDTIDENVQSIAAYEGDGVEILCYADDQLAERRFVTWQELGMDPLTDKSWTYYIPDTDPVYKYVLNYQTTVNMDNQTESVVVKNTAAGKGGIDSAYEVLSPSGSNLGISKTAARVTQDSVTWEIRLHLRDAAFDRQQLILTEHENSTTTDGRVTWYDDCLPYKWLDPDGTGSRLYKETLDTVEVSGLYDDETFVLYYGNLQDSSSPPAARYAGTQRTLTADDSWHSSKWLPEKLSIAFYRDSGRVQGGLNAPPDGSSDRTITVRLKTKFPEDWAQAARQQNVRSMDNVTWYYEHLNWVDVEGVFDVAKIAPYPIGVYKRVLRDASDQHSKSYNMVRDGRIYPVYYYQVLVSGVESDSPLIIDDLFDTSIFRLYEPHQDKQMSEKDYLSSGIPGSWDNWYYTRYGGISEFDWIKPELGTCLRIDEDPDHMLTQEETDYGVRFVMQQIPKDKNNRYYKFYGVEYWLTARDEEALKKIEEMAAASPTGEAVFMNTASCRNETAQARVTLKSKNDFTPIGKTSEQLVEYTDGSRSSADQLSAGKDIRRYVIKYTIDLNQEGAELNSGRKIVVEDSYSANLSVDFETITIRTDRNQYNSGTHAGDAIAEGAWYSTGSSDTGGQVSYDYSGNVGRFTIPDKTHVIIQYEATVIDPRENSMVTAENTVKMLQYSKTKTDTIDYAGTVESMALNPSVFIKKYERGHMESGLNGAVFQLFKHKPGTTGNTAADWEPMQYAPMYAPDGAHRIANPNAGQNITFTTGNLTIEGKAYGDGYANIELTQTEHGLNLEYDTTYGLREIQTPVRRGENGETVHFKNPHHDQFYCYQFTLTKNPSGVDYSQYIYRPDEILTVKNDPDSVGLRLRKKITGSCVLTDAEKNQLSYQLYVKANGRYQPIMKTVTQDGSSISVVNPDFVHISYQTVTAAENGCRLEGLRPQPGNALAEYLLVERGNAAILAAHPDWNWTGSYEWETGSAGNFSKQQWTVYDENGQHPESVYGAAFAVTRQDVQDNEQKEITLTNQYTEETITLRAVKKWTSPTGAGIDWPSGKRVRLELGTIRDGQFVKTAETELDHTADSSGEETPGTAVFRHLPKYVPGTTEQLAYAVREASQISGYHVIYPESSEAYALFGTESSVTIRNQANAVSLTVHKQWQNGSSTEPPPGAKAVMRLYAYTGTDASKAVRVSNVSDITLDGTADDEGETTPWTATFRNLPEYDSSGGLLSYIAREESCLPVGFCAAEDYAADNGTITNQPAVTAFSVTKKWQGTENNAWPDDTSSIAFTLRRRTRKGWADNTFAAVFTLRRDAVVSQTYTGLINPAVSAWNGAVLTVSGLPAMSARGEEWVYYLTEQPLKQFEIVYRNDRGYLIQGCVYAGGSITNVRSEHDLIVQKKVSGSFGSLEQCFDFTVMLTKSADAQPYRDTLAYEKTDAGGNVIQGELAFDSSGRAVFALCHNETICLKSIPADLHYMVEEADSGDGYRTTVCVNGTAPQSIRRAEGYLTGQTRLVYENKRDGSVPTGADSGLSPAFCIILAVMTVSAVTLYSVRRKKEKDGSGAHSQLS